MAPANSAVAAIAPAVRTVPARVPQPTLQQQHQQPPPPQQPSQPVPRPPQQPQPQHQPQQAGFNGAGRGQAPSHSSQQPAPQLVAPKAQAQPAQHATRVQYAPKPSSTPPQQQQQQMPNGPARPEAPPQAQVSTHPPPPNRLATHAQQEHAGSTRMVANGPVGGAGRVAVQDSAAAAANGAATSGAGGASRAGAPPSASQPPPGKAQTTHAQQDHAGPARMVANGPSGAGVSAATALPHDAPLPQRPRVVERHGYVQGAAAAAAAAVAAASGAEASGRGAAVGGAADKADAPAQGQAGPQTLRAKLAAQGNGEAAAAGRGGSVSGAIRGRERPGCRHGWLRCLRPSLLPDGRLGCRWGRRPRPVQVLA